MRITLILSVMCHMYAFSAGYSCMAWTRAGTSAVRTVPNLSRVFLGCVRFFCFTCRRGGVREQYRVAFMFEIVPAGEIWSLRQQLSFTPECLISQGTRASLAETPIQYTSYDTRKIAHLPRIIRHPPSHQTLRKIHPVWQIFLHPKNTNVRLEKKLKTIQKG